MPIDDDAAEIIRSALEPAATVKVKKRRSKRPLPNGLDTEGVSIDDFRAYMPSHNYIFIPSLTPWPGSSVNARCPPVDTGSRDEQGEPITISATAWLDHNRAVEQMTWAPGLPQIIENRLIIEGGWIDRPGVNCFNLYLPPRTTEGDATRVDKWLDHINYL
jgi:hypothetical protein